MIAGAFRNWFHRVFLRAHWARLWKSPDRPYWLVEGVRPGVRSAVDDGWFPAGAAFLDLGCGLGDNSAWLAERGFEVFGIDVSPAAIERARARHAGQERLHFEVADVCDPGTLHRKFPVVLDSGCLQVIPWQLRPLYVRSLLEWTEPGSRYLLRTGCDLMPDAESLLLPLFLEDFDLVSTRTHPKSDLPNERILSLSFRMIRR